MPAKDAALGAPAPGKCHADGTIVPLQQARTTGVANLFTLWPPRTNSSEHLRDEFISRMHARLAFNVLSLMAPQFFTGTSGIELQHQVRNSTSPSVEQPME
jgi:hypothetical protein